MRYLTAGESHGPQLTTIIEGLPAGMPLLKKTLMSNLQEDKKGMAVAVECKLKKILR